MLLNPLLIKSTLSCALLCFSYEQAGEPPPPRWHTYLLCLSLQGLQVVGDILQLLLQLRTFAEERRRAKEEEKRKGGEEGEEEERRDTGEIRGYKSQQEK